MEWIRVTAKTVEEAITEAAITLGCSSDNMEYNVIEKGGGGFFGIGAKKAVIEARKKKSDEDLMREVFGDETSAKPKKEHKAKEKKEKRTDSGKEASEQKKEKKEKKTEKEPSKKQEKASEKKAHQEAPKKEDAKKEELKKEEKPEAAEPVREAETVPAFTEEPEEPVKERAPRPPREPADPEVAKQRGESFLRDVFRTMGMDVEVTASFEEETLNIDIAGDDMGLLIGKRGQTLDSLQYLTSLVVNKGNAAYVRVKLDTEDYRSRRKTTLENLAKNIAKKVRQSGKPVFLEPMNPYERRIIHSALQADPYVTTHSEGEEPCRKVVVTLKKGVEPYDRDKERGHRTGRGDRYNRRDRGDRKRTWDKEKAQEAEEDVLKNIPQFIEMPDVTGEGEIKTFD